MIDLAVLARLSPMLLVLTAGSVTLAAPLPHRLDIRAPYNSADYAFIGEAIGERSVVALGESIHLTREMPLVRLNLVRYLHEQRGMDVLAFEGSLIAPGPRRSMPIVAARR